MDIPSFISVRFLLILPAVFIPLCLFYQLILYPYLLSPIRNVPGPPLGGPFLGHSQAFNDPGPVLREWGSKYGSIVRVVGPVGIEKIILMGPEALQRVLVSEWAEYPRPNYLRKILGLVAGHGLLTVTGDEYRRMRKAMNPAFSISNLMAQTEMYYDSIDVLVDILSNEISKETNPGNGKQFLLYDWMSKVTLDIIAETAFGYRTDSLHNPDNELALAYENLVSLQSGRCFLLIFFLFESSITGPNLAKLILLMYLPFGSRLLSSDFVFRFRHVFASKWVLGGVLSHITTLLTSLRSIRRISQEMLNEKLQSFAFDDSAITAGDMELAGKKDIMSLLVRAKVEYEKQQGSNFKQEAGGYGMSDGAMIDQVMTFLGAGHETTASGLSWTLYLLATHPEVQQRLREEVGPAFEGRNRPNYRMLKEMKWLDCVIMESLRVLPPAPITVRRAETTDYLEGYLIPKGTLLILSIQAINTSQETWGEDAEEFKPSRWLDLPKNVNLSFSFLSFLAGPHGCIGKTMAIVEMKAVIAALVCKFSFEPSYPDQTPKPTAAITMKPSDRMPLIIKNVI